VEFANVIIRVQLGRLLSRRTNVLEAGIVVEAYFLKVGQVGLEVVVVGLIG
jgi:hypothetical protein